MDRHQPVIELPASNLPPHAWVAQLETRSNQLFVALMVADPEPQKSASPSKSQCPIVQRDPRRPNFLTAGFSNSLEL